MDNLTNTVSIHLGEEYDFKECKIRKQSRTYTLSFGTFADVFLSLSQLKELNKKISVFLKSEGV